MSDTEQTSEATESPVEAREYEVKLRVTGYVTLITEAESQDEADQWAEECDVDPADIQIADVDVEYVEAVGA